MKKHMTKELLNRDVKNGVDRAKCEKVELVRRFNYGKNKRITKKGYHV